MRSKFCMNDHCRSTTPSEWKEGWCLKSGGFATLCYSCGSAYENVAFCETFHLDESGWRECRMCRKLIHCGCIASKYLFEYMDFGGIGCLSCTRCLGGHTSMPIQSIDTHPILVENRMDQNVFDKELENSAEACEPVQLFQSQNDDKIKQEESMNPAMEVSPCFVNLNQQSLKTSVPEKGEICVPKRTVKDTHECFNFSLSTPMGTPTSVLPFQQGHRPHHIVPKPPKASSNFEFESKSAISTPTRVPRPLAEGRGTRNQLLPRYWPRITDQELQKLSGDLKSTIVPLFEKVLSASDAGRIGRLVLPKACAEAYFPYINQSEGIPIRMQDIKGKEWTFQFRFWPNNNSRMYVLEGVTPCIQNMQLQAGDTVTFSRIDPGGKLVMGFRKAANNVETQHDSQNSTIANGGCSTETPLSVATENHTNGGREADNSLQRNAHFPEKKKIRNIGCKNKRLQLKITWEEAQHLLCPPPTVNPTIVVIEDYIFEEYDEPPVFGKRTVLESCNDWEPSGLEALANIAVLGDDIGDLGEPSTTKHPRHRPGCTCIVCIQPPSGKGKHEPTCKCNVCLTVKRRFKTLMLRKKKKQSVLEAEVVQGKDGILHKDDEPSLVHMNRYSDEDAYPNGDHDGVGTSKGQLDLNSHPNREDDTLPEMFLASLIHTAADSKVNTNILSINLPR